MDTGCHHDSKCPLQKQPEFHTTFGTVNFKERCPELIVLTFIN